jgi:phospholipid/cholesterol/gamma-HCH transport system substrate-binding protein
MKKENMNHVKLGIFITAGLAFLILMLYLIGKNKHLLGKGFILRARFENIQGLKKGNNVRFAGIDAGTVEEITVLNDTLIEVKMRLDANMKGVIRSNAITTIGTDGLVGNKIINITSPHQKSIPATENALLISKKPADTDAMLQTLGRTNENIYDITTKLKSMATGLDTSVLVQALLKDSQLVKELDRGVSTFSKTMKDIHQLTQKIKEWTRQIDEGKGILGALVFDTTIKEELKNTIVQYKEAGQKIVQFSDSVQQLVGSAQQFIDTGNGVVPFLWKDNAGKQQAVSILEETNRGLKQFNEVMEALKHSIFLRGYFRRQSKKIL